MRIIRHDDGSLTVPVAPGRHEGDAAGEAVTEPGSMVIRPGEGGLVGGTPSVQAFVDEVADRRAAM
jgi:hypothetical protein